MKSPLVAMLLLTACLVSAQNQSESTDAILRRLTNWVRYGTGKPSALFAFARTNGIPDSVTFDIAKRFLAEAEEKAAATPLPENKYTYDDPEQAMYRAGMYVSIFGGSGNRDILPFLEEKSLSPYEPVRRWAAVAYVKIAGLDAVPFVRKILSGSEEKYDLSCKYLVSKEFFDQIARAEAAKAPQGKIDAAYAMLVEQAQTVAYVGHADEIDKFLCKNLEDYRASVQREKVVERFVNSTNEFARANFKKKQQELQKVPKAERINLRTRFPGLSEMKTHEDKVSDEPASTDDK